MKDTQPSPSVIMGQLLSKSPVTTRSKFVDEGDEREGKNLLLLLVHVDDTCRRPRRRAKPWTAAQRPRCAPRRARAPPAPPRQDVNSLDPSLASRMSQLARAPIDTPNCPLSASQEHGGEASPGPRAFWGVAALCPLFLGRFPRKSNPILYVQPPRTVVF